MFPELARVFRFSAGVDRPVPWLVVIALALAGRVGHAAGAAASPAEPARQRLVSPHVARVLAEVTARQVGSAAPAVSSDARPRLEAGVRDVPANGIVRLPAYLVREPRLPSSEEVMSRHAREQVAMQKYFGEETSVDRVLNMFSPVYLWRKIPVLGKHPFMIGQFHGRGSGPARGAYTNEDRAMERYEADQMRERWDALAGLLSAEAAERVAHPDRPAPAK